MAKPRYAVELKSGNSPASFMAGHKAVDLDDDNPRFETTDEAVYLQVRELPFLKDVGEVKEKKATEKAEG